MWCWRRTARRQKMRKTLVSRQRGVNRDRHWARGCQTTQAATSRLRMDGEVPPGTQATRFETPHSATDPGLGWTLSNWLFPKWNILCMRLSWLFPLMHNESSLFFPALLGRVWCGTIQPGVCRHRAWTQPGKRRVSLDYHHCSAATGADTAVVYGSHTIWKITLRESLPTES